MPWSPDMKKTQRAARMLTPRVCNEENKKDRELTAHRKRVPVDMPGYTGYIQGYSSGPHYAHYSGRFGKDMQQGNLERKHPDLPFGTPNEMYSREANPRKKTNVKNRSNFILGDDRDRHWGTTYEEDTLAVEEQALPTAQSEEMITNWHYMNPSQRRVEYQKAMHFVTEEGRKNAESAVRDKITQRATGGAFAIRKAFKLFDRDGSGDIDPDEFKLAMLSFGLTFTDRQVLALFGSYDDDCSGALDYYEFLDKVLESDYTNADGTNVTSCRPKTPPRRHYVEEMDLYRQMVRLKQMYDHCAAHESHRICVDEARNFLMECGHKEPDEDCIIQIVQATAPATNGGLIFTELWDWFIGVLEVPVLDISPQMKINISAEEEEEGFKDTQGRKHQALKKMMSKAGLHGNGKQATAEEMAQWRRARAADVNNDGSATAEEIDAFHQKQKQDVMELKATVADAYPEQTHGKGPAELLIEDTPHLKINFNKSHHGSINYNHGSSGFNKTGHHVPKPPTSRPQTAGTARTAVLAPQPPNSSRSGSTTFRPFKSDGRPSSGKTRGTFESKRPQTAGTARSGASTYRCYERTGGNKASSRPASSRPATARTRIPDSMKRAWVSNAPRPSSGFRV